MLSEEDFGIISEFANRQVRKVGKQILEGQAEVAPYQLGNDTGCKFCPYHAVCGFDEKIPGYEYRELEKLEAEDAMNRMREEALEWE